MSARDSESGSSTYKGGSRSAGGLGNGGIGGGRGGGGMGGGAGRWGGIGARTGLTTGTKMVGTPGRDGLSATGRPGGMAQNPGAWGMRPQSSIARGTLGAPPAAPAVPGLLGEPVPAAAVPTIEDVPLPPAYTVNPFLKYTPPPGQYSEIYRNKLNDLIGKYGSPAAISGPGYTGPTGYWQKNPTSFPQHARDWEKSQWAENSIYGGMAPPSNRSELSNRNWSGSRQNIGGIGGGQGVTGFSSVGAPGFGGRR